VAVASMKGGAAPIDPMSLGEGWVSPVGQRFMDDKAAQSAVAAIPPPYDVAITGPDDAPGAGPASAGSRSASAASLTT